VRKYLNKAMGELATELTVGLLRLRKGYVDAAESLIKIIRPGRRYPYEFAVYRITGYRGRQSTPAGTSISGEDLRRDLQTFMLDLCDSFELNTGDYAEAAYDANSLARRFSVSTKTIQRWRRRGLPARRLVFPDGRRRIAFLESSVRWFVSRRPEAVARSTRFSQLSDAEREDIIRRAARMVAGTGCLLSEIVRRLAARTGRARETIRSILHDYDLKHPRNRIFQARPGPLTDAGKLRIYRLFLRGVSAGKLASEFSRSRSSIYRIVNGVRARQLLRRPIKYIYAPEFDAADADSVILATTVGCDSPKPVRRCSPGRSDDLPPYLKALYEVPLLDRDSEKNLFRRYNYLKYKADKLRGSIDIKGIRTPRLRQIEQLLLQANITKNLIVRANLRLVVSIAKKHVFGPQTLFELVSDGNVSLMQAVEKFDYCRGYRFSTYASWAIMRNFARSVPKERHQLDRFTTGYDELLNVAASLRIYDPNRINPMEIRETVDALLARLLPREREILAEHYGLEHGGRIKTLNQLGKELKLSKERVRQIELQALAKLRSLLPAQDANLLG